MKLLKTILIVASLGFLSRNFNGSELVERYLAIGIGMDCSLIKSGD